MTKFGKMLIAAFVLLCAIVVGVWFFFFRAGTPVPTQPGDGSHLTVPQPSGNTTVGYGSIDTGSDTSSGGNHIILSPDISSGFTSESEDSKVPETVDDVPLVNEDGIPTVEAIKRAQETDVNLYGRLVIPLAGINVRLYQTTEGRVLQADDSAVLFLLGNSVVIADMWKQGFSGLQNLTKGSEMYLVTNAGMTHYLCSRSEKASMVQNDLQYSDGSLVTNAPSGAISCYSQMNAAGDIWLCEFTDNGETTTSSTGSGSTDIPDGSTAEPSTQPSEPDAPPDWTSGAGYEFSAVD